MSLSVVLKKVNETPNDLIYSVGTPGESVGRVRLGKDTGEVEILEVCRTEAGPRPPFFLAQVVPRLHDYHERNTFPERDSWTR